MLQNFALGPYRNAQNPEADRLVRVMRFWALVALALAWITPSVVAYHPCPGNCSELWSLSRTQSGLAFRQLNQASGVNHTDLVLIPHDTTADLPVAQQQFRVSTLLSPAGPAGAGGSANATRQPGLYLGPQEGALLLSANVTLTLQYLTIQNAVATFLTNGTGSTGSAGGWSLTLASFALSPGSQLRLVRCVVVLPDCATAAELYEAAAAGQGQGTGAGAGPPPGTKWSASQVSPPDVFFEYLRTEQLEFVDVRVTCDEVCGSSGVRQLTVSNVSEWYQAMAVVSNNADNCQAYIVELSASLNLADALPLPASQQQTERRLQGEGTLGRPGARRALRASWSGGAKHDKVNDGSWRSRRRHILQATAPAIDAPLRFLTNVTLRGARSSGSAGQSVTVPVVLDAGLLSAALCVCGPGVVLALEGLTLLNLVAPAPGALALPLHFVDRPVPPASGEATAPRIVLSNVTLVLPQDEISYATSWFASYSSQPSALAPALVAWLDSVGLAVTALSIDASGTTFTEFRAWDLAASGLRITSTPPAGHRLLQLATGIGLLAASPKDAYPQAVTLHSSAALAAALNASAGPMVSQQGYKAYAGVPSIAALMLASMSANQTYAPVPHGRVVLQRSYVLGPVYNVTDAGSAAAVSSPPILDLGRRRDVWATIPDPSLSLAMRNMTVVGLDSPGRWGADPSLLRCLDLPLWALGVGQGGAGAAPRLALEGVTLGVSHQELKLWGACHQALEGSADPALDYGTELPVACRSLNLSAFSAMRTGPTTLRIVRLQGMGIHLTDCDLRDDLVPYNRYDLEALLPAPLPTPTPPPPPAAVGSGLIDDGDEGLVSHTRRWIIPVAVVAVVTFLSLVLIVIVYARHWQSGGQSQPYVNVHMLKMMAEEGLRPYALSTAEPAAAAGMGHYRAGQGGNDGGGSDVGGGRGAAAPLLKAGGTGATGSDGRGSAGVKARFGFFNRSSRLSSQAPAPAPADAAAQVGLTSPAKTADAASEHAAQAGYANVGEPASPPPPPLHHASNTDWHQAASRIPNGAPGMGAGRAASPDAMPGWDHAAQQLGGYGPSASAAAGVLPPGAATVIRQAAESSLLPAPPSAPVQEGGAGGQAGTARPSVPSVAGATAGYGQPDGSNGGAQEGKAAGAMDASDAEPLGQRIPSRAPSSRRGTQSGLAAVDASAGAIATSSLPTLAVTSAPSHVFARTSSTDLMSGCALPAAAAEDVFPEGSSPQRLSVGVGTGSSGSEARWPGGRWQDGQSTANLPATARQSANCHSSAHGSADTSAHGAQSVQRQSLPERRTELEASSSGTGSAGLCQSMSRRASGPLPHGLSTGGHTPSGPGSPALVGAASVPVDAPNASAAPARVPGLPPPAPNRRQQVSPVAPRISETPTGTSPVAAGASPPAASGGRRLFRPSMSMPKLPPQGGQADSGARAAADGAAQQLHASSSLRGAKRATFAGGSSTASAPRVSDSALAGGPSEGGSGGSVHSPSQSPALGHMGTGLYGGSGDEGAGPAGGGSVGPAEMAGSGNSGGSGASRPGLGRLLVGSLSTLFRVDSLTGGVMQRATSPGLGATPTAGASGGGTPSMSARQARISAVQMAEAGARSAAAGGGAAAARGGASARQLTGPGGGSIMGHAASLEAALSELTASVESRMGAAAGDNQLVVQEVLGSGAFGTVYKGLWKGLVVAVKTMTLTADAVAQGRHAALLEAALSKSIFHPHVVTTYTCDLKPMHVDSRRGGAMTGLTIMNETQVIQEWRLYIVQEFCDGGSLRHAVQSRAFLNPASGQPQLEWVLQMAREVAAGLQYLHEHSIIHGDLNPANVLLKRDHASPLGYAAKIADFGLSVHMHAEQSHVSNTKRGTPFYTAPEVTHAGNLTRFADVFSYGVLLWELYCSRNCWAYGPGGRLVSARGFPHLPPACPRPYAALMAACMQPAHKQRPTFKQIGMQLDSMLRELAWQARGGWGGAASDGGGGDWWGAAGATTQQQGWSQAWTQQQQQQSQAQSFQQSPPQRPLSPIGGQGPGGVSTAATGTAAPPTFARGSVGYGAAHAAGGGAASLTVDSHAQSQPVLPLRSSPFATAAVPPSWAPAATAIPRSTSDPSQADGSVGRNLQLATSASVAANFGVLRDGSGGSTESLLLGSSPVAPDALSFPNSRESAGLSGRPGAPWGSGALPAAAVQAGQGGGSAPATTELHRAGSGGLARGPSAPRLSRMSVASESAQEPRGSGSSGGNPLARSSSLPLQAAAALAHLNLPDGPAAGGGGSGVGAREGLPPAALQVAGTDLAASSTRPSPTEAKLGTASATAASPLHAEAAASPAHQLPAASEPQQFVGTATSGCQGTSGAAMPAAPYLPHSATAGGGGIAAVMRAFEIPAEPPRFARPDLPTVMEGEDDEGAASEASLVSQRRSPSHPHQSPPALEGLTGHALAGADTPSGGSLLVDPSDESLPPPPPPPPSLEPHAAPHTVRMNAAPQAAPSPPFTAPAASGPHPHASSAGQLQGEQQAASPPAAWQAGPQRHASTSLSGSQAGECSISLRLSREDWTPAAALDAAAPGARRPPPTGAAVPSQAAAPPAAALLEITPEAESGPQPAPQPPVFSRASLYTHGGVASVPDGVEPNASSAEAHWAQPPPQQQQQSSQHASYQHPAAPAFVRASLYTPPPEPLDGQAGVGQVAVGAMAAAGAAQGARAQASDAVGFARPSMASPGATSSRHLQRLSLGPSQQLAPRFEGPVAATAARPSMGTLPGLSPQQQHAMPTASPFMRPSMGAAQFGAVPSVQPPHPGAVQVPRPGAMAASPFARPSLAAASAGPPAHQRSSAPPCPWVADAPADSSEAGRFARPSMAVYPSAVTPQQQRQQAAGGAMAAPGADRPAPPMALQSPFARPSFRSPPAQQPALPDEGAAGSEPRPQAAHSQLPSQSAPEPQPDQSPFARPSFFAPWGGVSAPPPPPLPVPLHVGATLPALPGGAAAGEGHALRRSAGGAAGATAGGTAGVTTATAALLPVPNGMPPDSFGPLPPAGEQTHWSALPRPLPVHTVQGSGGGSGPACEGAPARLPPAAEAVRTANGHPLPVDQPTPTGSAADTAPTVSPPLLAGPPSLSHYATWRASGVFGSPVHHALMFEGGQAQGTGPLAATHGSVAHSPLAQPSVAALNGGNSVAHFGSGLGRGAPTASVSMNLSGAHAALPGDVGGALIGSIHGGGSAAVSVPIVRRPDPRSWAASPGIYGSAGAPQPHNVPSSAGPGGSHRSRSYSEAGPHLQQWHPQRHGPPASGHTAPWGPRSAAAAPTPPRFERHSLRTLEAAAVHPAGAGGGDAAAVSAAPAGSTAAATAAALLQQQPHSQQHWHSGLLRAVRHAVAGSTGRGRAAHSPLSSSAPPSSGATNTPDRSMGRSAGAAAGGGTPPSFGRRGMGLLADEVAQDDVEDGLPRMRLAAGGGIEEEVDELVAALGPDGGFAGSAEGRFVLSMASGGAPGLDPGAAGGSFLRSNSFDAALRLGKASLSTVPESGPSFSQVSLGPSSGGEAAGGRPGAALGRGSLGLSSAGSLGRGPSSRGGGEAAAAGVLPGRAAVGAAGERPARAGSGDGGAGTGAPGDGRGWEGGRWEGWEGVGEGRGGGPQPGLGAAAGAIAPGAIAAAAGAARGGGARGEAAARRPEAAAEGGGEGTLGGASTGTRGAG